ncbi:hypothetical protein GLW07_19070 [Bacillus hwajinpoensis]|uniref:Uncharacterized protein n=1 Tax=Guptibacillus hwajinpoensis TaxID=208199 RepID=A0A845F3Z5_9BACL|nr:hypothetical protein [Pseudalkalibacillus hwajinpoensis]MYL65464.1 hypothetical protein [Pseudalkalibacillus hwajinpoensis]
MKIAGEILIFALLALTTGLALEAIFDLSLSLFLIAIVLFAAYWFLRKLFIIKYSSFKGSRKTMILGLMIGLLIFVVNI